MRILRTLMLLAGVSAFMPSPPEEQTLTTADQAQASTAVPGLVSAASSAVSDVASFCIRQPGVCEAAGYVATKMEAKAKYSVRLIYEWASDASNEPKASPLENQADAGDPINTGSTQLADAAAAPDKSQSTLTIEDLIPEWRGPARHKKG